MASLREVQMSFAAALRDPSAACAVRPRAQLDIYRNNLHFAWRRALESSYPIVRRRVGDDYFHQLCVHYRERVPSRSGDLHDYDRDFAGFLGSYLEPDYAWLADLARLERSCVECSVAAEVPAISADLLARYSADQLEHLVFGLQPALKLHSSSYPVFSVWMANQQGNASPVDQSLGAEQGAVLPRDGLAQVHRLDATLFSFLSALAGGLGLGVAVTAAGLTEHALTDALAFLFRERFVCSLDVKGVLSTSPG